MIHRALARHGVDVRADSPDWAEVQAVLSRGDRRIADLLAGHPAGAPDRTPLLPDHGSAAAWTRSSMLGSGRSALRCPGMWSRAASAKTTSTMSSKLAARSETGLSCPPDSAGCLSCQACDADWAFRYGDNEDRPVPVGQRWALAGGGLAALDASKK